MNKGDAYVVGVTGGVGSGKTTVVEILKEKGWQIINVDELAQEIIQNDPQIQKQIKKVFGSGILYETGELKRREMANTVFSKKGLLNQLNHIIWPVLIQTLQQRIQEIKRNDSVPTAVDMAVIFEANCPSIFDYILTVTASLKTREYRLETRRHWTRKAIHQRINSQLNEKIKLEQSDYIIYNEGSIEELRKKIQIFIQWISKKDIMTRKE